MASRYAFLLASLTALFIMGHSELNREIKQAVKKQTMEPTDGTFQHLTKDAPQKTATPQTTEVMGLFITFEGIEGCGKTTQIRRLAAALRQQGHDIIETREPGGCDIADQIRAVLLDAKNSRMTSPAELLLYAAARAQHVAEVIRPALDAGKTVLCDRFCDATLAYQGYGRQLDINQITTLNDYACQGVRPDATLLLDLPVEIGLGRARQRNEQHTGPNEDRFEQESLNFHQRIRQAYLRLAKDEPQRFLTIDAQGSPQTVAERIASAITSVIQPADQS